MLCGILSASTLLKAMTWTRTRRIVTILGPKMYCHSVGALLKSPGLPFTSMLWKVCIVLNSITSSLLHTIVTNDGYGPVVSNSEGLTYDDYHKIGGLSFTQLAELRHRGAFSTVSHTFAACCIACAGSSDPRVVSLVKAYYYVWLPATQPWTCGLHFQDALACMQRNASALTRRSAGMPAMLTGILAPYLDSKFFHDSLLDLQAIADTPVVDLGTEDAPLPQVHALNCLKDIFTDARFGPSTEAHIADTLEIAASCLKTHMYDIVSPIEVFQYLLILHQMVNT